MRGGDGTGLADTLPRWLGTHWPELAPILQPTPRQPVPVNALSRPDVLTPLLERYGASFPASEHRAATSLWAQWFIGLTWPPLIAGIAVAGRLPAAEHLSVAISTSSRPEGLRLTGEGRCGAPGELLAVLVGELTAPVLEAVARQASLAPRVLWNVAASVASWTAVELERRLPFAAVCGLAAMLTAEAWPDGQANPMAGAIRRAGDGSRRRRVCCLRFRLPTIAACADCPVSARLDCP